MGELTPGATLIYERANGRIYAREFGKNERRIVGYDSSYQETAEFRYYKSEINQVLAMCETDPAMRELLDQLFVLYNLKSNHE
jgi:hypothetical protein